MEINPKIYDTEPLKKYYNLPIQENRKVRRKEVVILRKLCLTK